MYMCLSCNIHGSIHTDFLEGLMIIGPKIYNRYTPFMCVRTHECSVCIRACACVCTYMF